MNQYQAILFDLDGTLLDTAHDLILAFRSSVDADTSHIKDKELREVIGISSRAICDMLKDRGVDYGSFETFKKRFMQNYTHQGHAKTAPFEGIAAVIEHLNTKNIAWGIVTNKYYAGALDSVKNFPELNGYQCLIGADSAAYPKPAADPLLMASDMLDVNPANCLFIGDTTVDMEAAHNAKMHFALANYGYGQINTNKLPWNTNFILENVEDLIKIL